jgi:signal peptidase I
MSFDSSSEKVATIKESKDKKQAEKDAQEEKAFPKGPPKTVVREYFESLVVTVIMALFGITFIIQAVKVPTGSMQNTITIGDHLLVNKFVFAPPGGWTLPILPQRDIRRGDIIVFKYPGYPGANPRDEDPNNRPFVTNYVKRVIGLPGDKVEVRGQDVFVNDKLLPEHRIIAEDHQDDLSTRQREDSAPLEIKQNPPKKEGETYSVYYSQLPRGEERVWNVPSDSYFVMGDNRNNSADSRAWGFVRRDLIIGRAMFVYWSYDESKLGDIFSNTRWSRTGTMIK